MVNVRRGASKLGCLFTALVMAAVAYFGFGIAEIYVRSYRFSDALRTQARFARQLPDDVIQRHLRLLADSLGLPEEAGFVRIRRMRDSVEISAEYHENLVLPGRVRSVRFAPKAGMRF